MEKNNKGAKKTDKRTQNSPTYCKTQNVAHAVSLMKKLGKYYGDGYEKSKLKQSKCFAFSFLSIDFCEK